MTLEQFYAAVGGDYEQTLARLPSEALVKKFVLKYVDDGTCKELAEAITNRDWTTAFRAAHTLKGRAAHQGLVQLGQSASALTEALRGRDMQRASALYPETAAAYRQACAAIGELDTDA